MQQNKLLSEENYQKSKKKIARTALIVLIVGILIGGALIATGIIKSMNLESSTPEGRTVETIQAEIDAIEKELIPLKAQQNKEFKQNGFSEEYYRLDYEISDKNSEISELKMEKSKIDIGYNATKDKIERSKFIPFYMIGAFIIISSCMISGFIFLITKRREMAAFSAQQMMPVVQESAEKMAPTLGNVAKEIAKGVKEGLDENGKEEE